MTHFLVPHSCVFFGGTALIDYSLVSGMFQVGSKVTEVHAINIENQPLQIVKKLLQVRALFVYFLFVTIDVVVV